jgi:hypothetical protein
MRGTMLRKLDQILQTDAYDSVPYRPTPASTCAQFTLDEYMNIMMTGTLCGNFIRGSEFGEEKVD